MRFLNQKFRTTLFLLAATAVASGCSKTDELKLGTVEGVVSLDGKTLANAKVEFNPVIAAVPGKKGQPSGGGSFAITDENGRYRLNFNSHRKGAVLGEHSVRITTASLQVVPDGKLPKPEKVPSRYNIQSQLKFTVGEGKNDANFELTSATATARR